MFTLFDNIHPDTKILLGGCGGGHDCFVGLPLYFALKQKYKDVYIANLSFTQEKYLELFPKISESCYDISYDTNILSNDLKPAYFPEYELSREISEHVYAFVDEGMKKYEMSYTELVKNLNIDIIILCDGGCDSIMTGKEEHLGTPVEDVMSMLIINNMLDKKLISNAYLLLLGATVDTFVGIHRKDFLENIDNCEQSKILMEKILLTLNPEDINSQYTMKYKQIVEACTPYNSIVNSSICARLDGLNGNIFPPLLKNNNVQRCDGSGKTFELDDYLVTYYLLDLQKCVNRLHYKNLIELCDDSDDIDKIIMDINAQLWPTSESE